MPKLMDRVDPSLALESIDFQDTAFFKELTLACTDLKGTKKDAIPDSEVVPRFSAIVKHHTGLSVTIDIGDQHPCVDVPAVNKNNPLINAWVRNHVSSADGMKMIASAGGAARGTVSLRTGKVTGIFADMRATIHLPVDMFTGSKYTPEEISAVMLHEVGHLITYCEFMARSVTTNQVLAGLAKALDGSAGVDEREAVLITAKKALKLSDLDTKQLANSNNSKVAEIVVVSNLVKETKSELGSNIYDMCSWEYLSDEYAARQGAGRHLVTALDKLYRGQWNISFRSLPAYLAFEAFKLLTLFVLPGFGVMLIAMDGSNDTYDRPGARMKRVRNQIVQNLKDGDLTKEEVAHLEADLKVIDVALGQVEDRRQFFEFLWETAWPSSRKARNQELLQKELEDLAVNELFVKAAELKQFA